MPKINDTKKERRKAGEIKPYALHTIDDNEDGAIPAAINANRRRKEIWFLRIDTGSYPLAAFFVESLKGTYRGQKLTMLVNRKITPTIPRMRASIPLI